MRITKICADYYQKRLRWKTIRKEAESTIYLRPTAPIDKHYAIEVATVEVERAGRLYSKKTLVVQLKGL